MTHDLRIRRAAQLVLAGLVIQLATTLYWTPLTFVLFTMLGVPLVLLGVAVYVFTVWRILKERQVL